MEPLFKKRKLMLNAFKLRRDQEPKQEPKEFPEHVVKECPSCHEYNLYEDLIKHHYVCPICGYHYKISARERLRQVCDPKSFKELHRDLRLVKESTFPNYQAKLTKAQKQLGMSEALIIGTCRIEHHPVVIGVMDSHFMMGSMGAVVGEKITRAIEYATKKKLPLILFTTSGGARMQEGIISLVQMAKTSAALARHKEAGLLYIAYLTHPTTGGVLASFGMLGDIQLSEPAALVGFAGKRVIESTINETLPDNFQHAEFVQEKGFIDAIVERRDMRHTLAKLLAFHTGGTL